MNPRRPTPLLLALAALALAAAPPAADAQDVESFWGGLRARLAEGEVLRATGSLHLQAALNRFNSASGAVRRDAPLTYGATAGVHFDVLGIQAPFSLAVSGRDTRYSLPAYAFAGLSPSYRWVTLHGGDRTMAFSPYSLSGVNFRGGGLELTPGRWYVAGMYGRLRGERIEDAGAIQTGLALDDYRRVGHGLKVGYAPGDDSEVTLSYFGSADGFSESDSGDVARAALGILPERNAVLTVGARHRLSALVSLEAEAARSVLTRDDTAPELPGGGAMGSLFGLVTPRTSTQGANAVSGAVNFTPAFAKFRLRYERIDPGYRTHGSLFFQDDLENVTAGATAPLFARRLNLHLSGGLQRSDLRGDRAAALRRVIGSASAAVVWREGVTTTLQASNFSTTNRYRSLDLARPLVDSVVLAQTQLSLSATHAMALGDGDAQQLTVAGSYQRADLIRDGEADARQGTTFLLASVNYALRPSERHGFTGGLLANGNGTATAQILLVGPSAGYGYRLPEDRGELNARVSYNLTRVSLRGAGLAPGAEPTSTGRLLSLGLDAGYRLTERQRLRAAASFIAAGDTGAQPGYDDLQLQLAYALTL